MSSRIRSAPLFYQTEWSPSATSSELETLTLTGDEARHAINARRLREGDAVEISNGRGAHGTGIVESAISRPPQLTLSIEKTTIESQTGIELVLASALPKGERQSTLLDMATQLGMQRFIPLDCDFSAVRFQSKMITRWQRILLSGCKQSRRTYLPKIDLQTSIAQLLTTIDEFSLVLYGARQGETLSDAVNNAIQIGRRVVVVIGPEAGFSETEIKLLQDHPKAFAMTAGPHILRTETAAIALLSLANQITNR